MSAGHKHRIVTVRRDGRLHRALTGVTVRRTTDRAHAERSRFVYAETPGGYRMSLLGFLHGLCGLTIAVKGKVGP